MTLSEYLAAHRLTKAEFADQIAVSSESVRRYCADERIPDKPVMRRIVEVTGGKVQPNDFYRHSEAA